MNHINCINNYLIIIFIEWNPAFCGHDCSEENSYHSQLLIDPADRESYSTPWRQITSLARHAFPKTKVYNHVPKTVTRCQKGVKVLYPRSSSLRLVLDFRTLAIRLRTLLHFSVYFITLTISFNTLTLRASCLFEQILNVIEKMGYKFKVCFTWQSNTIVSQALRKQYFYYFRTWDTKSHRTLCVFVTDEVYNE